MLAPLVRRAVKVAALPASVPSRRRQGDVVVLLYHRVGRGASEIDLPQRVFERHLEYLRDRHSPVGLDDALADSNGGIVVSFDDGYRDFADVVVPLLVRYEVPALLYLATGLVTDGGGSDRLSWSQLRDAVATGLVTVGSHTHGHVNLLLCDPATAADEMRRSKDLIEGELDRPCTHFAYPWGVASPEADRAARSMFETAALHAWKNNRRGRIDPHRLGRVPVLRSDAHVFFRAKAGGGLNAEGWMYRALRRGPWRFA